MNREIEFRVYDKDLKKMRCLNTSHDFICFNEDGSGYYHNMQTGLGDWFSGLMQYTGLKDKNGKKIFEGDIIIAHDIKFIIKFGEYRTKLFEKEYSSAIDTKQFGWYAETIEDKDQCNLVVPNGIEVIGNIYENNLESQV